MMAQCLRNVSKYSLPCVNTYRGQSTQSVIVTNKRKKQKSLLGLDGERYLFGQTFGRLRAAGPIVDQPVTVFAWSWITMQKFSLSSCDTFPIQKKKKKSPISLTLIVGGVAAGPFVHERSFGQARAPGRRHGQAIHVAHEARDGRVL